MHAARNNPRPSCLMACAETGAVDRKSTRLNSSHLGISYAVFCLKKKKKTQKTKQPTKEKNNKKIKKTEERPSKNKTPTSKITEDVKSKPRSRKCAKKAVVRESTV